MHIEERLEFLEKQNKELQEKVDYLMSIKTDRFVTAKELAEIMQCSVNNVYIKIRSGEIFATDKLGSIPRIPMSQFYENNPKEKRDIKPKKEKIKKDSKEDEMEALKKFVFG